jgi:glycosyltransferase involved in cell wall biosynthesis
MALSAVRLAREEISDLQLIVFGQSRPRGPLKLPGNSRYFRCPDQSELAAVYAGCDAWLFASESEGFGLPVVEAMACRTPVIATPAGIAPEYCASGGGILVPFNDAQAMARAIVSVCKMSDASWREMSDAAYRTARSCTWNDACDRFEEAIKTIVESARSISACAR